MASLSMDTIRGLVEACTRSPVTRDLLLAGLPPALVATWRGGDSPMAQFLYAFNELNELARDGQDQPLLDALKTASMFARGRQEQKVFDLAIDELKRSGGADDQTRKRAFFEIATRNMKRAYEKIGCQVTPPLEAKATPFLAEDAKGRVSVVAVAYQDEDDPSTDVEAAIAEVLKWLDVARKGAEDAQGYVVLAPSGGHLERERVSQAGLYPLDYSQPRALHVATIEAVVRCLLDEARTTTGGGFCVLDGCDALAAEVALASFFRELRTRVLLLLRPRNSDAVAFMDELFHVCARVFLKQGAPAPLPIGTRWHTRSPQECACEIFRQHGESVAPVTLVPALQEGLVCPVFNCDAVSPSPTATERMLISRLVESLSAQSKTIVVFSPADVRTAQRVLESLRGGGWEARIARAVAETR